MTSPVSIAGSQHPIRATYRLQFHERFRLADALAIVPYLHELGISHIYASPLTKARPHSTHGYDVCDFQQLNPELGTEADLETLVIALRENKMGLVLDIVPNHMGTGADNPWWRDVLTYGRHSVFADYFDIDWEHPDPRTQGKVLLPVLGGRYARALEKKQITLHAGPHGPSLHYAEYEFPLRPDFPLAEADINHLNSNPGALDGLIQRQNYRLAFWKCGDSGLNYRRFFSITSLAGLRMEEEKVFNDSHALIKKWIEQKWLDGLRVDHPDGLRHPTLYLQRLRELAPEAWIGVEKILAPGESLPEAWPVAGTTGYDFLNQTNELFVERASERELTDFYSAFTREPIDYEPLLRDKKRAVLDQLFGAEVDRLLALAVRIADRNWRWRDFTRTELREAISEMAACFPVYRIYGSGEDRYDYECSCVDQAAAAARFRRSELPPEVFHMLSEVLLRQVTGDSENEFADRFQQLSGPAMAKGAEDTAFYCFNRFISLNEVGANPGQFGLPVESFHQFCVRQKQTWPHTLLASMTHDTKRSEDVRARLNVLTEIPDEWIAAVCGWTAMNAIHHGGHFPDRNVEYLFYQTLVGAWPISTDRMLAYLEKAAREAKQHTNWGDPNAAYEQALHDFVEAAMNHAGFMAEVEQFVARIKTSGWINSLSQTLIKLTAPGVPDFYQGGELWNLSLVDPDNRQPVDYGIRLRLFAQAKVISAPEAWRRRDEGMAKLWLIWKALNLRADHPDIFAGAGSYEPLFTDAEQTAQLIAFMRDGRAITIVPRLPLTRHHHRLNTHLDLPGGTWCNVLTGESIAGQRVSLNRLLSLFPVALLIRKEPG